MPHKIYYTLKPYLPKAMLLQYRRFWARFVRARYRHDWPICQAAGTAPPDWPGWPGEKKFALVLTHDVDTHKGVRWCREMLELERGLGFRSGVFFVAERYPIPDDLRDYIVSNDCEVGVHGLKHDGRLYSSDAEFQERAIRIRQYLKQWKAVGFRSPAMHHRLDLLGTLGTEYDCSTFDVDPFEPQPDGMNTIFPFWVSGTGDHSGYVELPYTIPQDFTVFILLRQRGIDLWKRKLDWIAERGGMALIITHPDYMDFEGGRRSGSTVYPSQYYANFLEYIRKRYAGQYWHVLPRDIASFWKQTREKSAAEQPLALTEGPVNTPLVNIR
ncbi:MAG: polysaccharide deacetylase family protein [Planctomycetota bacterium]|jgi:hypothetical protein